MSDRKPRRQRTADLKATVLRRHYVDKVATSALCALRDGYALQPSLVLPAVARWQKNHGKVCEARKLTHRDNWLTPAEQAAIVKFHDEHPTEGYRRLTYMMIDPATDASRLHSPVGLHPRPHLALLPAVEVLRTGSNGAMERGL